METVSDFIFLGSQITVDGYCSHEIKRHLFLGRKVMTNLDSILKSRDITLLTNIHPVKPDSPSAVVLEPKKLKSVTVSIVFPVLWFSQYS